MDRFSCLAYLLYQVNHPYIKEKAIEMVCGDITLEEALKDQTLRPYLVQAEKMLKDEELQMEEVYHFVEEHLYN